MLGYHIGINEWEQTAGPAVQIFTHGPRTKHPIKSLDHAIWRERCKSRPVYSHQTYCTSWKPEGMAHMLDQYKTAVAIGTRGLVLHLGLLSPAQHLDVLANIPIVKGCPIILEMRAVKPTQQWGYQKPDEINALINEIIKRGYGPDQICICLDTAHLSAGKQAISTPEQAGAWIESLEHWEYIGLLHLNGNEYDPNVRAGDKHTIPGCCNDKIWHGKGGGRGWLEFVVWHMVERGRDVIVEVDYGPELVEFLKCVKHNIQNLNNQNVKSGSDTKCDS